MVLRVTQSGALPVSRDAPGYAAVLRVLGVADTCDVGGLDGPILDANGGAARAGEVQAQIIIIILSGAPSIFPPPIPTKSRILVTNLQMFALYT